MSLKTFAKHELDELKELFGEVEGEAIDILRASIKAVAADIRAHGLDAVKTTIAAMSAAIAAAKASDKSNSEAGHAALAVVETAVVAGVVGETQIAVAAGKAALSADAAHAIVTAQITDHTAA